MKTKSFAILVLIMFIFCPFATAKKENPLKLIQSHKTQKISSLWGTFKPKGVYVVLQIKIGEVLDFTEDDIFLKINGKKHTLTKIGLLTKCLFNLSGKSNIKITSKDKKKIFETLHKDGKRSFRIYMPTDLYFVFDVPTNAISAEYNLKSYKIPIAISSLSYETMPDVKSIVPTTPIIPPPIIPPSINFPPPTIPPFKGPTVVAPIKPPKSHPRIQTGSIDYTEIDKLFPKSTSDDLVGICSLKIINPQNTSVRILVKRKKDGGGKRFSVKASSNRTVSIPQGKYDFYLIYLHKPKDLYKGSDFSVTHSKGVQITLKKVVSGNYPIRKVK